MMNIIKAIQKINPNAIVTIISDIDGSFKTKWHNGTTPISKEDIEAQLPIVEFEMALDELRAKRNKLLADTDFHALSDQTLSPEMSAYRQALRDITEGLTTVEEVKAVVFPTKP